MITEADIIQNLRERQLSLPPLVLATDSDMPVAGCGPNRDIDAFVRVTWGRKSWRFAAAVKRLSTPKVLRETLASLPAAPKGSRGPWPMVIVPYLAPEQIADLETRGVSGIDLSGNGIVTIPGELLVVRTGQPNRFPQSAPIRNVFRGDSSLVARVFLLQPQFQSVGAVADAVRARGGAVALSTVSKVIRRLTDDLIVGRGDGGVRLLQSDKLIDSLAREFRTPTCDGRWVGRLALPVGAADGDALSDAVRAAAERVGGGGGARVVMTGASSAPRYATLAREPLVAYYCTAPIADLVAALGPAAQATDRFPTLELRRTTDATAYFDARDGGLYASPVQSFLELANGDKRQREAAAQVRERILGKLAVSREPADAR